MVLTAYFALSPVTGLFCHRRLRSKVLSLPGWANKTPQNLTPASGRQDHTILPSAKASLVSVLLIAHKSLRTRPAIPSRAKRCRVHRIPPRVRDDGQRPSGGVGWRQFVEMICPTGEAKYFCKEDSTQKCPTGKSHRSVSTISAVRARRCRRHCHAASRGAHGSLEGRARAHLNGGPKRYR